MKRTRAGSAIALVAIAAFTLSCPKTPSSTGAEVDESLVLGKVAGKPFTVRDLRNKMKYQYGAVGDYNTPEGIEQARQILKSSVDEMCWVHLGEKKGYTNDPAFKDTWELSRKYILADRAIEHEVRSKETPTDEEIRKYYDDHQAEFTAPERVQVAHVLTKTRAEALAARARILKGESITNVAEEVSIDDPTRVNGGLIGWLTATGGAGHLGNLPQFNGTAMKLQKGEVSDPVQIPSGWSVLYALDHQPAQVLPFDGKVIEAAKQKVKTTKHNQIFSSTLEGLKKDYGAEVNMDNFDKFAMSLLPEDALWGKALTEKDPDRKITEYQAIVRRFPTGPHAAQAQFMIGFVLADERKDYPNAREAFETFIKKYPDQELVSSARWMLDNMSKPDLDRQNLEQIRRQARFGR